MGDYLDHVEKWTSLKECYVRSSWIPWYWDLRCALRLIHVVCIIALIQRNLLDHLLCANLLIWYCGEGEIQTFILRCGVQACSDILSRFVHWFVL